MGLDDAPRPFLHDVRNRLSGSASMTNFPHLPPGHEPGPQSLRNRTGRPILEWFVGLVGTGMFLSGMFAAAGGRGSKFDPIEELVGGTFFGLMGLGCALWAYRAWRGRRPPKLRARLRGLNLSVDRDQARRGEQVTVTITVAERVERLEVGLVCTELYDFQSHAQTKAGAVTVRQTGQENAHEEWRALELTSGEQSGTFEIPPEAPYSYEGSCVSYAWRVSARTVRALRSDPRLDRPVWVDP